MDIKEWLESWVEKLSGNKTQQWLENWTKNEEQSTSKEEK